MLQEVTGEPEKVEKVLQRAVNVCHTNTPPMQSEDPEKERKELNFLWHLRVVYTTLGRVSDAQQLFEQVEQRWKGRMIAWNSDGRTGPLVLECFRHMAVFTYVQVQLWQSQNLVSSDPKNEPGNYSTYESNGHFVMESPLYLAQCKEATKRQASTMSDTDYTEYELEPKSS